MLSRLLTCILFLCAYYLSANDLRGDTIDIRTHRLTLDLTDFNTKIIYADAQLGIRSKMNGVNHLKLDLLKLTVDSVKVNGVDVAVIYNDSVITVPFPSALNQGDSATIHVFYHGRPLQESGDFGGFYWTNTYAFNIGVSFLADPHTYGRVWFPCFDNFEERSLYEFIVTTRSNHKAFCNGTLLSETNGVNTKIWHWKLEDDIPSYLASVAVSDYATLSDTVHGMQGIIPIQLAARPPDTTNLKNAFVHLKDAFHIQEKYWGAYHWERVGFCIVPFSSGAMEHATNVSFMNLYLTVLRSEAETTMAHELSHHWFGDLVTCATASDMWLNEGWAAYNEYLFLEKFYNDSVYRREVSDNHEFVLHQAHTRDGSYLPVSGVPSEQTYGTTVYRKGADMVHTLRYYMGDSLFFHCVKNYLTDYAFQTATTAILRDYLSQCSGIDLTDYFADWIYAPGFPHFSLEWKQILPTTGAGFHVSLLIRQRLHYTDHFYNNVPVKVSYFDAQWNRTDEWVNVSGECTPHSTMLINEPVYIAIDLDQKLQDAITDDWKIMRTPGTYDFGVAKARVTTSTTDSTLVRMEYNWVRPEPMKNKIASLHLHDKHFWTVDGLMDNLEASARFDYNGTDVSLDAGFITNREDSIIMMYRANADSEWVAADSFVVTTGANLNDKQGYVTVYNLRKGQYTFAIYNSSITDTTTTEASCVFNSVAENEVSNFSFRLFPNPTNNSFTITFLPNRFTSYSIFDLTGRRVGEKPIASGQNHVDHNVSEMASGAYLITLTNNSGWRYSRIFVKQ